jgi:Rrf2 family transcriptional regulator, cysteine metabolism repressor
MLRITTRSKYGMAALFEWARKHVHKPLVVREIAAKINVSPTYLEQLLNRLTRAGLVRAIRGQNGGYMLAHPPEEIMLIDILQALEGPLEIAKDLPPDDITLSYFQEVDENIRRVLDVSLSAVIAREQSQRVMFYI